MAAAAVRSAGPATAAEVLELGTLGDGRACATVASASEPGARRTVTFDDTPMGRRYRCTCPAATWRPGQQTCRHILAARAAWQRMARDAAWDTLWAEVG